MQPPHTSRFSAQTLAPGRSILTLIAALAVSGTALTAPQDSQLAALNGEWVYLEDRTEGRPLEQQRPPMSGKFSFRVEEGAVILVSGHGSGHRDVRVALDGSVTEMAGTDSVTRYRAGWKDGTFSYQTETVRSGASGPVIRKEFRMTTDGLLVRVSIGADATSASSAIYRHPQDIELPAPAKATIGDLGWLAGAWVGTRGADGAISFEERWSPPRGGAMLATSRTVSRGKMSAFEFLRVVERDGGLVYIAQPNGAAPTEFVLTELSATRAVFENPRHDYPKRITYELAREHGLTATIGLSKGGTPRLFEFTREGSE